MKQTKGITLIALVVTIIILIILAGVSISFIFGEEGIFKRANNAANKYNVAEAKEKMESILLDKLSKGITEGKVIGSIEEDEEWQYIINCLCTDEEVEWIKAGKLLGAITPIDVTGLGSVLVKLKAYENEFEIGRDLQVSVANEEDGAPTATPGATASLEPTETPEPTPESSPEPTPASAVQFKNSEGTEAVATPAVGSVVEIGEEKFKVIKISADGKKVTAIPYYNLVLNANPVKQATAENAGSAGKVPFAPNHATWNNYVISGSWLTKNQNVDLNYQGSYCKQPIEDYETYLQSLGATNVIARIGRAYPVGHAGVTITDAEYIGNGGQHLNPSGVGAYWLGSTNAEYDDFVLSTEADGSRSSHGNFDQQYGIGFSSGAPYYDASRATVGVRPVIIITLP